MYKIAKLVIVVFVAVIISLAIGGNGCLWMGDSQSGSSQGNSPGAGGILSLAIIPAPPNGAQNVPINSQLSWNNVPNAPLYDVYFGASNPPPYAATVRNGWASYRTRYNPGLLSYGTTYFWQINPKNSTDSSIGLVWSFSTAPLPPAPKATAPNPADNATDVAITTQLSWSSASAVSSFDVYLGVTNPPPFQTNLQKTVYTIQYYNPGLLNYATTYYWQIASRNANGVTTGDVWTFSTVSPSLPPQATQPYPANNATSVRINTILSWASSTTADSYDVYFGPASAVPQGGTPSYATNVSKKLYRTSYNPSLLDYGTTYYWEVDARNDIGVTTGTLWQFTTQSQPALTPATDPSPANGADNALTTTILSWASSNDVILYDVYFGTTNPPSARATIIGTQGRTQYNPGLLVISTTYYWRIDSRNSIGKITGNVWSFTTASLLPAQVTSPNPANGATNVVTTTQLSWAVAARATSYDVYFGTTTTGWTPVVTSTGVLQYAPTTLSNNMIYYWRVDSQNTYGMTSGNIWSFTTGLVATAVDDYVWVSGGGGVRRILKSSPAISTTIAVGTFPYGVAVDGTYCWVANSGSNNVTRILKADLSTTTIAVGSWPVGIAVDATYCWVANGDSNTVTRINKSDLSKTTIAVGGSPWGIAVDGTYCWVANYDGTVTRIKKSDLSTTMIAVLGELSGIVVDESYCWVVNNNSVTRIKKSDLSSTTIGVGNIPRGVAVDANYVWVANLGDFVVTRIRKSDLSTTNISAGSGPLGIAVDTTYCWVTIDNEGNLMRIQKTDLTTTTIAGVGRGFGDMTGYAYDNYAQKP